MVSYYNNPAAMYRHQPSVAGQTTQFHHGAPSVQSWYAGNYHPQTAQVNPTPGPSYCLQDEPQMWHHHSVFHPDYPDLAHTGGVPMHHPHHPHQQLLDPEYMKPESQLPSPSVTVSGSDMSSPGATGGNVSPPNGRPPPVRSPFEWIKKTSYQTQPNPDAGVLTAEFLLLDTSAQECPDLPGQNSVVHWKGSAAGAFFQERWFSDRTIIKSEKKLLGNVEAAVDRLRLEFCGKTRTKDKYRVVYTDQQRVELEKEFYYSRYITIRRKAELASNLGLSERQVKIWFQNRRAKERKQVKKREELTTHKDTSSILHQHTGLLQQNQHQTQLPHPIVPVAVAQLM